MSDVVGLNVVVTISTVTKVVSDSFVVVYGILPNQSIELRLFKRMANFALKNVSDFHNLSKYILTIDLTNLEFPPIFPDVQMTSSTTLFFKY